MAVRLEVESPIQGPSPRSMTRSYLPFEPPMGETGTRQRQLDLPTGLETGPDQAFLILLFLYLNRLIQGGQFQLPVPFIIYLSPRAMKFAPLDRIYFPPLK